MKPSFWTACALAIALLCQSALAQETQSLPKPRYAVFDYMKVAPSNADAYVNLEKNLWKGIHEQRLEDGLIVAWYLCRIENPPDQQRDYDFVTVNIYDSFAKLEEPYPEKYFTNVSAQDMQKTAESRDLFRSEVWRLEDSVLSAPSDDPFIVVDYMQPTAGREAEYYALETDVWKKVHAARIKGGLMNLWTLSSRVFPAGSETPYAFVTINAYPSREAASDPSINQLLAPVFQGLSEQQVALLNNTETLRTVVKEDVWKRIDQVTPPPKREP